jgi:hypothetical protein
MATRLRPRSRDVESESSRQTDRADGPEPKIRLSTRSKMSEKTRTSSRDSMEIEAL